MKKIIESASLLFTLMVWGQRHDQLSFQTVQKERRARKLNPNTPLLVLVVLALLWPYSPAQAQSWTNVGTAGFSAGEAYNQSMAINSSGTPYVAFLDGENSYKTSVMKFNGTAWVNVGTAGFSAGSAEYHSLAIDASGIPYVAYRDFDNSFKTTVMKFYEGAWVNVGTAGFSTDRASYQSLAIDDSGVPYVSFEDLGNSDKATVMKFNGTAWVNVGTAGFSAGSASYPSLAINASGVPYVVYADGGNDGKTTVMKFNGTAWENVGPAGFSAGAALNNSLVIDASGVPYVAFHDKGNADKTTVMKYSGTAWVNVGTAGFSTGSSGYQSLAIDASGVLYVAFSEGGNSYKTRVMKFNGTAWENVGSTGFSAGAASYQSLAIDAAGVPYVAYSDAGNANKTTVMKFTPVPTIAISTPIEVDDKVNAAEDDHVIVQGTTTTVEDDQTVTVTFNDGSNPTVQVTGTVSSNAWTASEADISGLDNTSITITAEVSNVAGTAAEDTKSITLDNVAPADFTATPSHNPAGRANYLSSKVVYSGLEIGAELIVKVSVEGTTGEFTLKSTISSTTHDIVISESQYDDLADGNFKYEATLTDPSGNISNTLITTIALDRVLPVFSSSTSLNIAENITGTAYTAVATDTNTITYSLGSDNDEALFDIVSTSGVVSFKSAPDFEDPKDDDANHTYVINVIANDGSNSANQNVTITVTDIDDTVLGISTGSLNSVSIYPNPVTKENFTVSFEKAFSGAVSVLDLEGRLIQTIDVVGKNVVLNLSGEVPGIYLLKLTSPEGTVQTKLIKQ